MTARGPRHRRRHLPNPDRPGGTRTDGTPYRVALCGLVRDLPHISLVDDPGDATCQRCADALERDIAPAGIPNYLRARAYGRATTALRERHRAEFDELLAAALPAVLAEEAADR